MVSHPTLQPSERKRPKPLPKAGVWGWVEFANAAGGRKVCRPQQKDLPVIPITDANPDDKKKGTASRRYPSSVHLMLNRFRFYNSLRLLA